MRLATIVAAVWLAVSPAMATTEALQRQIFNTATVPQGTTAMGVAARRAFAEAALAYWKDFDRRIPRNSPSDQEWLESELGTNDSARLGRALNSPQYALWLLSRDSSDCVMLFETIVPLIGGDRLTETYYWLKTTSCWQDASDTAQYLRNAGLSNGRLDDTFKMQFFSYALSATNGAVANGAASSEPMP